MSPPITRLPETADALWPFYEELNRTFRFYIALTVFANLGYGVLFGLFGALVLFVDDPRAPFLLVVPAMVSTGFAALSLFGVREAIGLARALRTCGEALGLAHTTRGVMLTVQTALTLAFHALFALGFYLVIFLAALRLAAADVA